MLPVLRPVVTVLVMWMTLLFARVKPRAGLLQLPYLAYVLVTLWRLYCFWKDNPTADRIACSPAQRSHSQMPQKLHHTQLGVDISRRKSGGNRIWQIWQNETVDGLQWMPVERQPLQSAKSGPLCPFQCGHHVALLPTTGNAPSVCLHIAIGE